MQKVIKIAISEIQVKSIEDLKSPRFNNEPCIFVGIRKSDDKYLDKYLAPIFTIEGVAGLINTAFEAAVFIKVSEFEERKNNKND